MRKLPRPVIDKWVMATLLGEYCFLVLWWPMLDATLARYFSAWAHKRLNEQWLKLNLPVLGSARPVDRAGAESLLVIDVDEQGVAHRGETELNLEQYLSDEAEAAVLRWHLDREAVRSGAYDLPVFVVLRADRKVTFPKLNAIVMACQQHGFRQFALRAVFPEAAEEGLTPFENAAQ